MPNPIDIKKGDRFSRLVIVEEHKNDTDSRMFLVKCDCGNEKVVRLQALRQKLTKSCGCLVRETSKKVHILHGHKGKNGPSKTYKSWGLMIQRCTNPHNKSYKNYGERGITVSKRWLKFENFLADMGERPMGLSIDRIDNDKGYSKNNCRWADQFQQNSNTRKSVKITWNGKTMSPKEWAKEIGVNVDTIYLRRKRGVTLPDLLKKRLNRWKIKNN